MQHDWLQEAIVISAMLRASKQTTTQANILTGTGNGTNGRRQDDKLTSKRREEANGERAVRISTLFSVSGLASGTGPMSAVNCFVTGLGPSGVRPASFPFHFFLISCFVQPPPAICCFLVVARPATPARIIMDGVCCLFIVRPSEMALAPPPPTWSTALSHLLGAFSYFPSPLLSLLLLLLFPPVLA